jgi:hypothetical protein
VSKGSGERVGGDVERKGKEGVQRHGARRIVAERGVNLEGIVKRMDQRTYAPRVDA